MTSSFHFDAIEDLTKERFAKILRQNWKDLGTNFTGIQSLTWKRLDQGVLSQVYRVIVTYEFQGEEAQGSSIPTQWIVKLPRKDFSLEWMFETEKVFYEILAPALPHNLPFTVPKLLFGSDSSLILQGIQNVECHELISGTPEDKMDCVTRVMASLHASTWKSEFFATETRNLQQPPGMGQRLNPLQKEYLFVQQWREAVDAIKVVNGDFTAARDFIVKLCEQLELRRLRDIHDMVHSQQLCAVHGDFNISNFLFPREEGQKPFLIDWATSGFGNPMTDVAFFLMLNEGAASNAMEWLQQYHDELKKCNPELHAEFPFSTMLQNFRWAVLYQWMILVAYDRISRQLSADGDPKQSETKLQHFANVNRRAVTVMYCVGGFDIVSQLPFVTDLECQQAKDYNTNTPLTI